MAQEGSVQVAPKGPSIYRINAIIGDSIQVRHERGWNGLDAMTRLSARLHEEGVHLFTLSILDRKDVQ